MILFFIKTPYNEEFINIPNSMYWAWQTMFCLGYGDIVPTTMLGKIAASWVSVFGIIMMSVLILSLRGRSFLLYQHVMEMERKQNVIKAYEEGSKGIVKSKT